MREKYDVINVERLKDRGEIQDLRMQLKKMILRLALAFMCLVFHPQVKVLYY